MKQLRCVEQLYPASQYTVEDIEKVLSHKIKFFPKKNANIKIELNENGIYVAKISFMFEERIKIKDKILEFKNKIIKKDRSIKINTLKINRVNLKKERKLKRDKEINIEKNHMEKKSLLEERFKIDIHTKNKECMPIKKYFVDEINTKKELEKENRNLKEKDIKKAKIKKSKYEKYLEENNVLKPI